MSTPLYPPGPQPRFAPLANLRALGRDPLGFFTALARDYGPVCSFRLGSRRLYFFSGPDAVREVLVAVKPGTMRKGFLLRPVWNLITGILGRGLLTSEGEFHDRQRKLVAPAFHRERLAGYATIMAEALDAHLARPAWREGAVVNVADELSQLTLVVVARSLFGADLSGSAATISRALTGLLELVDTLRTPLGAVLGLMPFSPAGLRYRIVKRQLDSAILGIIAQRRAEGPATDRGDLLSMLLLTRDEATGAPGMDARQVRDEAMTLLLAGHETTASALAWTLHLLSRNPEIQARVRAEARAANPGGDALTLAALPALGYARRVFTESLRLYPPAWLLARRTCSPIEVAGWKLPAGATCLLSPYVTQRDARWYPDPARFDPERWTPEAEAARPRHAFMAFGAGSRSCAGEAFAWIEGVLLLAGLVGRWQFDPAPGMPDPVATPAVTLRPRGGVHLVLRKI